jgi:prophage maintenance system killer protein
MRRTGSLPCPLLHPDKLESAINRPRWAAHYEGANIVRQAVLLAVGISQAQAFEEGNKRAGFASADAFLRLNGVAFVGDSILFAGWLIVIAESSAGSQREESTEGFQRWLAEQVVPVETS